MKKYKLTGETVTIKGTVLHRIQALQDFFNVKSGDLGGWIEKESNLSQLGNAWVYGNAFVLDNAWVYGNALVYGNARVYGNACVYGNALVYENALVYGNARVYGNALVYGNARVYENALVYGKASVYGKAIVMGYAFVYGNAIVMGDAIVKKSPDYQVFKNTWSSNRYFTWTRSNNKWNVGCFHGTGEELIKRAYDDSELSGKCYEAVVRLRKYLNEIEKSNN